MLCIGNAIVDGFAKVDEAFLSRFDLQKPTQHIDYNRAAGILAALKDITLRAGGGASTVAKVASELGVPSCFVGAVGTDATGQVFAKELSNAGVKTSLSYREAPTGLCLILTKPDGQSCIAACPSAALQFTAGDIPEALYNSATLMVIDGYMLWRTDFVHELLEQARQRAIPVALDIGSTANAKRYAKDIIFYCSEYRLILFMNEPESKALCPGSEAEKEEFFTALSAQKAFPIIVVKLSHRGAFVCSEGALERAFAEPLSNVCSIGAGDAFCAGFLSAFLKGKSTALCAIMGNEVAGAFIKKCIIIT